MAKASSAAAVAVVDYDATWDTKSNRGGIRVTSQRGRDLVLSDIDSSAEFIAILTLLQGQKTVFVRPSGVLTTAP